MHCSIAGTPPQDTAARHTGPTTPMMRLAEPEILTLPAQEADGEGQWRTVVHNDPVNTMTYVTWVFQHYFGLPNSVAERKMLEVHHHGRSVLSRGTRAHMEADVYAMHSYGLHATVEADTPTGNEWGE